MRLELRLGDPDAVLTRLDAIWRSLASPHQVEPMLARQSPTDYLAAALTTAAIRGVTTPLAALAAPAWARRRRLRGASAAALAALAALPRPAAVGVSAASRRQLQSLPPPPEAITAWHEEWAAWRTELRSSLRTQLLPLLGQVANPNPNPNPNLNPNPNPHLNPNPSPNPNRWRHWRRRARPC